MASIKERNGKYVVIYTYKNEYGERKQKWETFEKLAEAKKRRAEVEFKKTTGEIIVPQCTYVHELLDEYIKLYGREKWALSTYDSNVGVINNYIRPIIGNTKLKDVNTRYIEKYYQKLQLTPAKSGAVLRRNSSEFVTPARIREIHKLLKSCFRQAVKWEMVARNPVEYATVPKYSPKKREIWTAEDLQYALEVCEDDLLRMAINLTFACSLRIGELLGLTWDCVDITEEAMKDHRAHVVIDKELQRISKSAAENLGDKDIIFKFPESSEKNVTTRVLKTLKTESSVRKVFIPTSVAVMLQEWRRKQDETKEYLGGEYQDFNLVLATSFGLPIGDSYLRGRMNKLIKDYNLPKIVFHSLRHTSITYKLKLNGGDIKSVQGDSGHAQANMVTEVYSHIIDEDRRKNAELIEEAFYNKENLDPDMKKKTNETINIPDNVDIELVNKVLANPEFMKLLQAVEATMKK